MRILKLGTVGAAALLFAVACTQTTTNVNSPGNTATNVTNTANVNAAPVNTGSNANAAAVDTAMMGKDLYTKFCSKCHKDDGTGGPTEIEGKKINPEDLTSAEVKGFTDDKIAGYITNGEPDEGMPAFKDRLTPEQINEVVKYIRTEFHN